ncbi:MAG TPA: DnaJ domain-containing protein [Nitrospiraceae bacterium]|nr:DnaJ domain-containing protein [Nitrospiraceae bacterium]
MAFLDYYEVLSVPPTASLEQIERAYKHLVQFSHPDKFAGNPSAEAWANERMKVIHEAMTVLLDPARRAKYDQEYSVGKDRQAQHRRPKAHEQPAETQVRCPTCEGAGDVECLTCNGRGDLSCPGCQGDRLVPCPTCSGAGTLSSEEYDHIIQEHLRSERQAQTTHARHGGRQHPSQDPFWQVGYWDRPAPPRIKLRPAVALSVLIPGAGQIYNGEPQKGLTYLGIGLLLFLGIGLLKGPGVLLWLGFWLYNVYDAHSTAERRHS